ncbi:MAG TPA: hypothetical protein GX717_08520, partial [Clostridiaceae bacterium]|nr:hypothetical protein [Clostridiaceae bacterium]
MLFNRLLATRTTAIIVPILVVIVIVLGVYFLIMLRQKGNLVVLSRATQPNARPELDPEAVLASLDI